MPSQALARVMYVHYSTSCLLLCMCRVRIMSVESISMLLQRMKPQVSSKRNTERPTGSTVVLEVERFIKKFEILWTRSSDSYPPRVFCLYPYFCLSNSFSLVFLFLSIFSLYLSSLSLSYIPCQ